MSDEPTTRTASHRSADGRGRTDFGDSRSLPDDRPRGRRAVLSELLPSGRSRTIITCEGGPGRLVFPPSPEEVLFGLGASRLIVVSGDAFDRLLAVPGAARTLLEQLAATLAQKQEALSNFAFTRHIDRVRRRLLQLARDYGHVARDGIRIDFPVSHTILAEMIGSSRETVTRALDELQHMGFVARRGHAYRLLVSPECVLGAVSA
jgi:biotin operon repressor